MNNNLQPPDTGRLTELLRESRTAPDLPSGFQAAVWRRIEREDRAPWSAWLRVANPWAQLRWALALAAVLLLGGMGLGVRSGYELAQQDAQARYVASVAPHPLR